MLKRFLIRSRFTPFFRKQLHKYFLKLAAINLVDSQKLFLESCGVLQYQDSIASGERFAIRNVLPKYLVDESIIFDVGANEGDFTDEVLTQFPDARVIAFEPHPTTFRKLSARYSNRSPRVEVFNVGLSSQPGNIALYDYESNDGSQHASTYAAVLTDIHKASRTACHHVPVTTLDEFSRCNRIERIDFLKIDTEGHELEILKGAADLLKSHKVSIIQFEFNEMNIVSRVFMKDFYQLLTGYEFYRLSRDRLISLGDYESRHEIFWFQNVLAVRRDLPVRGAI